MLLAFGGHFQEQPVKYERCGGSDHPVRRVCLWSGLPRCYSGAMIGGAA